MDALATIRGLYRVHMSEHSKNETAQAELTAKFTEIMDHYAAIYLRGKILDGLIPLLLFDDSSDKWYGVESTDIHHDGSPAAYRVLELPGETTCDVCHYMNGKTLPIELMERFVTAPPFHYHCKGSIEVLNNNGDVMFRIGPEAPEVPIPPAYIAPPDDDEFLDMIQTLIDVLGFIPWFGTIADAVNVGISIARGNYIDAALSGLAMIPIVEFASVGIKWLRNVLKYSDEAAAIIRNADEVVESVGRAADEIVEEAVESTARLLKPHDLLEELASSGVKYSADDIVMVIKTPDGVLLWLENGNATSGLTHIIDRHAVDFANRGIDDIPDFMNTILRESPIRTGSGTTGLFAEYMFDGKLYRVAYGTNGYIVSFYPI